MIATGGQPLVRAGRRGPVALTRFFLSLENTPAQSSWGSVAGPDECSGEEDCRSNRHASPLARGSTRKKVETYYYDIRNGSSTTKDEHHGVP